jgi:hypothetical protein
VNESFYVSKIWKIWLTVEPEFDALLETIPIFLPFALIEQLLMCPISPFESSNLLG